MKMHWFGIFVLVLLGLYACDKQDDLLGDHQVTNQPTATRASSQLRSFGNCSSRRWETNFRDRNKSFISW